MIRGQSCLGQLSCLVNHKVRPYIPILDFHCHLTAMNNPRTLPAEMADLLDTRVHERVFAYLPVHYGEFGETGDGKCFDVGVFARTINMLIGLGEVEHPRDWPISEALALVKSSRETVDPAMHPIVHPVECKKPCLVVIDECGAPALLVDGAARIIMASLKGVESVRAVFVKKEMLDRFIENAGENRARFATDALDNGILERIHDVTGRRGGAPLTTNAKRERHETALGPLVPAENKQTDGPGYRPGRFSRALTWVEFDETSKNKGRKAEDVMQRQVSSAISRTVAELAVVKHLTKDDKARTRYLEQLRGPHIYDPKDVAYAEEMKRLGVENRGRIVHLGIGRIGRIRDVVTSSFDCASNLDVQNLERQVQREGRNWSVDDLERVGVWRLAALGHLRHGLIGHTTAKRNLMRDTARRKDLWTAGGTSDPKVSVRRPVASLFDTFHEADSRDFSAWHNKTMLMHAAFASGVNPCHIWSSLQPHFTAFFWAIQAGAMVRGDNPVIPVFAAEAYLAYRALENVGGVSPYTAMWIEADKFLEVAGAPNTILAQCYAAAQSHRERPLRTDTQFLDEVSTEQH
jgi:hypothetical protein